MIVLAQSVGLSETLAAAQRFLPRLVAFVVVLVVGYAVTWLLVRAVTGVLARMGFDQAVRRGGVGRMLASVGHDATTLLGRVVFACLMLLVLQLAFAAFGPNPISASLAGVIAFLPRAFVAIVIVVLAGAIAAIVRELVLAQLGTLSYGRLLAGSAYALVFGIGVFAALSQLQIAPAIVNGLFYGLVAAVVGVVVVAVGGGGIAPMRERWEQALARVDTEAVRIRQTTQHQREQRAAAERERQAAAERERQATAERERQATAERERQAAAERERHAAAERAERQATIEHERHAAADRDTAQLHAQGTDPDAPGRTREQERRTAREFEALAQRGSYTDEQLRAARELAEFDRQHHASADDSANGERFDVRNGERRPVGADPTDQAAGGLDGFPAAPGGDAFTGEQRQAAWDLEAFRREERQAGEQRQARDAYGAGGDDHRYAEQGNDYGYPEPDSDYGTAVPTRPDDPRTDSDGGGLDYRRRLRTARRSRPDERPPIRYRGGDAGRDARRYEAGDDQTRPVDVERTQSLDATPWDAPER